MTVLLVAVARTLAMPGPAPRSEPGVAALLSGAIDGIVAERGFVWEPSAGWLSDGLLGRDVMFLGSERAGALRDLYRARVRVSREGRPIEVTRVTNLSRTPLGDETHLIAANRYVAFATRSGGRIQGITVLDLTDTEQRQGGWLVRLLMMMDNCFSVGNTAGLSRAELVFGAPPATLAMELHDQSLIMALGDRRRPAAWDLVSMRLNMGAHDDFSASAYRAPTIAKHPAHLFINALREMVGTATADTFEALVFGARTRLLRTAMALRASDEVTAGVVERQPAGGWPPASITPIFRHPLAHEGQWQPAPMRWLPPAVGMTGKAEPYLVQTRLRPDPDAPFAAVRLVAIDTRQLELRIEAGFEEPRPLTGPRGRGRIPRRELARTVAAFNGAFQTQHGAYGMRVDGRDLLPPKMGAATVAIDAHGRSYMGPWSEAAAALPWRSLRQNLDPLIDHGQINPSGRQRWGFALAGQSYLTERSALCRTADGFLVYGWGIQLSARTLALGLQRAGCREAMHLDINPGHVGFVYLNAGHKPLRAELLAPEMSIAPRRFVEASPKDFFYLVLHDPTPHAGALALSPDGGAQPPPVWLPAVHQARTSLLGTELRVLVFATDRFNWQIRAGTHERAAATSRDGLSNAALARTLAAIGLGVALRKRNRRGLVLDGVATLPIRPGLGLLSTDAHGVVHVRRSVEEMVLGGDASELVLLAEGGTLRSEAREISTRRARAAACVLAGEHLLIAIGRGDSLEPHARALLSAGCARVVGLNRGKQVEAFVHRVGGESAPLASYDDTVLYAAARPSLGRARPLRGEQ